MLFKDLFHALKGRHEWIKIKNKCEVKDGVLVLFMTDINENLNILALKYLDYYRKKKYMNKVIILTDQIGIQRMWEKDPIAQTDVVCLKNDQCKALMKYYQLQVFYSDFLVVSLNQPSGNTVSNMLRSGKMTEEELLLGSIYI